MNRLLANTFPEILNLSTFLNHDPNSTRFFSRFTPALDIAETKDAFKIICDCPGLTKDQINIEMDEKGRSVRIFGDIKQENKNEQYHHIERVTGKFDRVVSLPSKVDIEKADASLVNGVLTIAVPKKDPPKQENKPRSIKIQERLMSSL